MRSALVSVIGVLEWEENFVAIVEINISMSVDGFVTGPNVNEYPGLGENGEILHAWLDEGDREKILHEQLFGPAGAVVTSRKVYDLTDGWGEDGLYKMPVVVLTHRPHEVIVKGDTTFTFVTEGIEHAIALAARAAGAKKVHVMGGASVVQQVLNAGLADELVLHVAPVLFGAGTPLFEHIGGPIRLERLEVTESRFATHVKFRVVK
jgi:dihydrofolate reductase